MLNRFLLAVFTTVIFACSAPHSVIAATKAQSIEFLLSQVRTAAGGALVSGKVYFYAAGTTTAKTVWLDRDKATPAANPYTLDSNGTAQLYGDGLYRVVIKTSTGATAYDRDNLSFVEFSGYLDLPDLPVIDVRTFMDGQSGRNTLAAWQASPSSTDVTAAIQAAFDSISGSTTNTPIVIPAGDFLVTQLVLPEGIDLRGSGGAVQGSSGYGSRFIQKSGSTGDVFRVASHLSGSEHLWWGKIRNIGVYGNTSNSAGWGISFRDADGSVVTPQNQTVLEDVEVRYMPSGGIEFPQGGIPMYLNRIMLLYNHGPGIKYTGATNSTQSIDFQNISGDANNGGLISLNSVDERGNVNIYNMKSENYTNPGWATAYQENAIVVTGCTNAVINVFGASHYSAVPDGGNFKKPGSFIYITDGSIPKISWQGVAIRVRPGDTGTDPYIIENASGSIAVPYAYKSGTTSPYYSGHIFDLNRSGTATVGDVSITDTVTPTLNIGRISATSGDSTTVNFRDRLGNSKVKLDPSLGLRLSSPQIGSGTLSGGSATISDTSITASSRILIMPTSQSANAGYLSYSNSAGASFTVHSSNAADDRSFVFLRIEPY